MYRFLDLENGVYRVNGTAYIVSRDGSIEMEIPLVQFESESDYEAAEKDEEFCFEGVEKIIA